MTSAFLKPKDQYKRNINPIGHYVQQTSYYLSKMTGKPSDEIKVKLIEKLKKGELEGFVNPAITFYERNEQGDKEKTDGRLLSYIQNVVKEGNILIPTFTVNLSSDKQPSFLVDFIDHNVKARSVNKQIALKAEVEGNHNLFIQANNNQINNKTYNNSASGAFAAKSSILHNPTAHSTLTSVTRTVSSLGNSINEKMIAGNRHYRNSDITLYNIISIASDLDRDKISRTINKYNLKYPTVDETIACIKYSSNLYWVDNKSFKKIEDFINKLDDVERAGVVYISDFFHIRKLNDTFVRNFLTSLSKKVTGINVEDPISVLKKANDNTVNLAHHIFMKEVQGIGKDYTKVSEEIRQDLAATCMNIDKVIDDHRDFIDAFFLSDNVPCTTAHIPNMIRRSVVLSDTDSTMFSVDEYVNWYFGKLIFNEEAFAVAASIMFIVTQCIAHMLAIFSANMNVRPEKLHTLAMKPEFTFPVFAQTSVAKHYYTLINVREGNVFKAPSLEIKGVHLKNSALPKEIKKGLEDKMKDILDNVYSGNMVSIKDEIKFVIDKENYIKEALLNNNIEFFKRSKIKLPEAYTKSQEESPYVHHQLWIDVFEPKYGAIERPPYGVIKIPTLLINRTAVKSWIESIEDKELSKRLAEWFKKKKKNDLPTMYLPILYVQSFGIPREIKDIMNIDKIVLELTTGNRMILESLGYFPKSGWLLSEYA